MRTKVDYWIAVLCALHSFSGCAELSRITGSTWHDKCEWVAEEYFDDPQVVALCKAIEANDLIEIDRLVAAGADVNTKGKGKMTPLLWAFPDNKLKRFARLLEHGADPNVVIESDFNTRGAMRAGDSVTHMACKSSFPGYFVAVFTHGGDPNLPKTTTLGSNETPLFTVIMSSTGNKKRKVLRLIEMGANPDHISGLGVTPAMLAAGWGGQYDIVLALLKAGADYKVYQPNQNTRLVHTVIGEERRRSTWTPKQKSDYERLVRWLKDHGESFESASEDIRRWNSWSRTTGEFRRKMDAEIAQRKAREARAKRAAEEAKNADD